MRYGRAAEAEVMLAAAEIGTEPDGRTTRNALTDMMLSPDEIPTKPGVYLVHL